jgi:hypothetical protein
VYFFKFGECPGVDIDAALVILAEIHEFLCIIIFIEYFLSEIFLFLLSVLIHFVINYFKIITKSH